MIDKGNKGENSQTLKTDLDKSLSAVLTLNTIAHTMGAAGVGSEVSYLFNGEYLGIASAILTLLVLVLSEVIPKTLGARYCNALAKPSALLILWLIRLLYPVVWMLQICSKLISSSGHHSSFSRVELKAIAGLAGESGTITDDEAEMVQNILDLQNTTVRDVMTPYNLVFHVSSDLTTAEFVAQHVPVDFARIPLVEEDESVHSYVIYSEVLEAHIAGRDTALSELAHHLENVADTTPAQTAFDSMVENASQLWSTNLVRRWESSRTKIYWSPLSVNRSRMKRIYMQVHVTLCWPNRRTTPQRKTPPTATTKTCNRMSKQLILRSLVVVAFLASTQSVYSADWAQFRGANSAGISDDTKVPTKFGPGDKELWSVPVASGHSSPCVIGNQLILTAAQREKHQLHSVSIDRQSGNQNWNFKLDVAELERGHPSFNPASSTVASDGEQIIAYFGSYGLVCLSMDGKLAWEKRMPLTKSYAGNAISPIIAGGKVILYRGNYVDHFLAAWDKRSGKELWKVKNGERFTPNMACTAVPIIHEHQLIVHAVRAVQSFNLESGQLIWELKCSTTATSTPVICEGEVVVATWNQTGEESLRPNFPTFDELLANNDKNGDKRIDRQEIPKLFYFHRSEGTEAPQNGYPFQFNHADPNKDGKIERAEWQVILDREEDRQKGYDMAVAIPQQPRAGNESDIRRLEKQGIPKCHRRSIKMVSYTW